MNIEFQKLNIRNILKKVIIMSLLRKRHNRNYSNYTLVSTFFVSTALLLGEPNLARSAVFEQLDSGSVVKMDDGVSVDTPSTSQRSDHATEASLQGETKDLLEVPSRHSEDLTNKPAGAVLLDMPSATSRKSASSRITPTAPGANQHQLQFPQPRQLSRAFSAEQAEMRRLAADVARSYARTRGVTRANLDRDTFVNLFTSMIHRESNFNPSAISPAGAKGLGQLMPATARELGVCDAFSARQNLDGAARYLTSMLDRFGSPELALAAYNAGPDAVQKYGGVPPYRETNQYVADILNAAGRTPQVSTGRFQQEAVAEDVSFTQPKFSLAAFFGMSDIAPENNVRCDFGRGPTKLGQSVIE
jgi:hypothetical protein